jgi:hypothetical protein
MDLTGQIGSLVLLGHFSLEAELFECLSTSLNNSALKNVCSTVATRTGVDDMPSFSTTNYRKFADTTVSAKV